MRISAQLGMILAAIFALICYTVAIVTFTSLGSIADPAQAADARGYAWFWVFLASVATVIGLVTWRWTPKETDDEA